MLRIQNFPPSILHTKGENTALVDEHASKNNSCCSLIPMGLRIQALKACQNKHKILKVQI